MAAMGRACGRFAAFISSVQQAPPIPDAKAERYYSLALTNWETGAVDCQAGATAADAALLKTSGEHTNTGTGYFQKASARIVTLLRAAG
jgi:hypothetical protein